MTWGPWASAGAPVTVAPYASTFAFPAGSGYYEFYSVATDNLGNSEPTPAFAQASTHYTAPPPQTQTITFAAISPVQVGTGFSLGASASSGLSVSYASQTSAVCTVAGSTVSTVAVGTCSIVASQAGNASWLAANAVTQSFSVTALDQTITFGAVGNQTLGNAPVSLSATASSGLAVSFAIAPQSAGVCSIVAGQVNLLAQGACTVIASQSGNGTYAAAPAVSRTFQISASTSSGGGDTGDVPLPAWALAMLGAALAGAVRRARTNSK